MSKYCSETGQSHSNHTALFCPDCGTSLQSSTFSSSATRRTTENTDQVVIDLVDSPTHKSQFILSQIDGTKPIQSQERRTIAAIARTESIQQTRKLSQKEISETVCTRIQALTISVIAKLKGEECPLRRLKLQCFPGHVGAT